MECANHLKDTKQEAAINVHVFEHVYMCSTHSNMPTISRETTLAFAVKLIRGIPAAVAKHVMKEDHTIKMEDAEWMNHSPWYWQSCTLEAWHIQSEQHRLQTDDDDRFLVEYNTLIHLSHPSIPH